MNVSLQCDRDSCFCFKFSATPGGAESPMHEYNPEVQDSDVNEYNPELPDLDDDAEYNPDVSANMEVRH